MCFFPFLAPSAAAERIPNGKNRLIIRFTAAGGEIYFLGTAPQKSGHLPPCLGQRLFGFLPCRMEAGRISEAGLHIGKHGLKGNRAHFCGSRIVRINKSAHTQFSFLYPRLQELAQSSLRQLPSTVFTFNTQSTNRGVDRYRSPVSGNSTTMVFPSFSGRFAT